MPAQLSTGSTNLRPLHHGWQASDNAKSQFERAMRDVERFDATLQA
jgi:hypothetical protein